MRRPSEFELIAKYFAPIAGPGGLGLLDDAALIRPPAGHDLVITKDMLAAGRHFFADDPPDLIARKALRVNLSDLAAKGAKPLGFFLGLALPEDWNARWMQKFAAGLRADAKAFRCPLLGGDTIRAAGGLTLSITAFGAVPKGRMVKRQSARIGDILFVTGAIGDAALGLRLRMEERAFPSPFAVEGSREGGALAAKHRRFLLGRFLLPEPRNALAPALRAHASAAMDISDGLIGDAAKLAGKGQGILIRAASVPLSAAARAAVAAEPALLEAALTGGDDYEILCAVPPGKAAAFQRAARRAGVAVARIGEVVKGQGAVILRDAAGNAISLSKTSFDHFSG